jgi:hypothetical protein
MPTPVPYSSLLNLLVLREQYAFAAEFDRELAGDERYQDAGNKRKSLKRARTPSAPKNLPENKRQKTGCRACGLHGHELSRCFYVFPELRHKGFKPHKDRVIKFLLTRCHYMYHFKHYSLNMLVAFYLREKPLHSIMAFYSFTVVN